MAYHNKRLSSTKRAYLAGFRKGKKIGYSKGKYSKYKSKSRSYGRRR